MFPNRIYIHRDYHGALVLHSIRVMIVIRYASKEPSQSANRFETGSLLCSIKKDTKVNNLSSEDCQRRNNSRDEYVSNKAGLQNCLT